jgi:hypothetical protein
MTEQDPWAGRQVRPRPTETAWGPWMQVQPPLGQAAGHTLIARTLETPLGEFVIHFTPEGLEQFCRQGLTQARMARAGILPATTPPGNGQPHP